MACLSLFLSSLLSFSIPVGSISGLIGAGKTTLANALSKEMGLPVYHEPVADNEYLADFYKDMKKYSFQLQVMLAYVCFPLLLCVGVCFFVEYVSDMYRERHGHVHEVSLSCVHVSYERFMYLQLVNSPLFYVSLSMSLSHAHTQAHSL